MRRLKTYANVITNAKTTSSKSEQLNPAQVRFGWAKININPCKNRATRQSALSRTLLVLTAMKKRREADLKVVVVAHGVSFEVEVIEAQPNLAS